MTLDEIKAMTSLEEIEVRLNAINVEKDGEGADLDALTEETRSLIERKDAIMVEVEARKNDIQNVIDGAGDTIKQFKKEERTKMTIEELRKNPEYVRAYADFIKAGGKDDKEVRALASELAETNGVVPVPQVVLDTVQTAWETDTGIISRIRKMYVKGVLKVPYEVSATGAVIHKENTPAPAQEELVIGSVEIIPETIKKWLLVTDELLSMKSDAFLMYIYDEITHQIIKKYEDDIIANLVATTNANGLTSTEVTATLSATTIFNALAGLAGKARNPVAVMNKQLFFNEIMSLKDTTERPIYNIVSENGRPQYMLAGVPVEFNDTLPATATGVYMVVGDFDGYMGNYPNGEDVKIIADPYSKAEDDVVKFVGKLYVGHGITRPNYFVRVKSA